MGRGLSRWAWVLLSWPLALAACGHPQADEKVAASSSRVGELHLAWAGRFDDGSRLLVEPLTEGAATSDAPSELAFARGLGLVAPEETLLRATWVPSPTAARADMASLDLSGSEQRYRAFTAPDLDRLLAAATEAQASRLRLYWYACVVGMVDAPVEGDLMVQERYRRLLHGPGGSPAATEGLRAELGARSIMLMPRHWTSQARRRFLEASPTADD